jgi:alpha-mannosidase
MFSKIFHSATKNVFLFFAIALLTQNVSAQKEIPYFGKINWINGFAKEISGENITYFSAFPDYVTKTLST